MSSAIGRWRFSIGLGLHIAGSKRRSPRTPRPAPVQSYQMADTGRRFILYRVYDSAGQLLYVGATTNPSLRLQAHGSTRPWWDDAARIEIAHFNDFDQLAAAEIEAIKEESPRYNQVHSPASAMPWAFKQRQRRPGEGSLFQRATDGLWIGSIEVRSADGKRLQKRVSSKSRAEALRKLEVLRSSEALKPGGC
jgi:hypothetical protein